MAEKKVTTMVIKVDLDCEKCHRKIKKVLCKIPQIENQVFDEKAKTVTVTVVCCSPEKIKKKIRRMGDESVQYIEILGRKQQPPPTPAAKEHEKTKDQKGIPNKTQKPEPKGKDKVETPNVAPVRDCCQECYEGRHGGPCFEVYGRPQPSFYGPQVPISCYEAYGQPVYDSWVCSSYYYYSGCRRGCCVGRRDCLNEENWWGCIVM